MKVPTLKMERSQDFHTAPPRPQRSTGSIKHFNGPKRTLSRWDGLRKDPMLWFDDGDCVVHLYTIGGSQRGPSFRLWYHHIEALKSRYLMEHCLRRREVSDKSKVYELYIPAPASLAKEQAYEYHLVTRNFFAYATSRPLVGEKLGIALARLMERIEEWQPESDTKDMFMRYYEQQGYAKLAGNVDYALASLTLAEHAKMNALWTESFVHCVGMHDQLYLSAEFGPLSNTTKALATRASLEMDLHVTRVIQALGTFLEDELGPEHLGLSKPARDHLDRFRSCLHNYYVEKLGYFPPKEDGPWNKRLWMKMYHAFQSLYEYLVDSESSTDPANSRNVNGGICVAQNVQAFDERHRYPPLPHPVPLLPIVPMRKRSASVKRGLKLGRPSSIADLSTRQALTDATNTQNADIMACELVQEYQRFERRNLEEKLSIGEARKVRWLLVYGVLQMLISITRAPVEVRDTETPLYPLCVLTATPPAWLDKEASRKRQASTTNLLELPELPPSPEEGRSSRISIHPDCEADCAEDYFNSQGPSRRTSQADLTALAPAPLRLRGPQSRTASFRYSMSTGVSALSRSFSRRSSVQRMQMPETRPSSLAPSLAGSSSCGPLEEDRVSNATDDEDVARRELSFQIEAEASQIQQSTKNALAAFDFGLDNVNEEPILEADQLEEFVDHTAFTPMAADISRSTSDASTNATGKSVVESDRSSMLMFEMESASTDPSSAEDEEEYKQSCGALRPLSYASSMHTDVNCDSGAPFGVRQPLQQAYGGRAKQSISAGCYVPTGFRGIGERMPSDRTIVPVHRRIGSDESVHSLGKRRFVAEVDELEEQMRGRCRIR